MACKIFSFGYEKEPCWRKMTSVLTLLTWFLFQQASGENGRTSEEVEDRKETTAWSRKQRWARFASNIFTTKWLWKVWWSIFYLLAMENNCGLWVVCRHEPWTGGFLAVIPPSDDEHWQCSLTSAADSGILEDSLLSDSDYKLESFSRNTDWD